MTLLLGPPSSGKTTLLLALAGRLGSGLQVYNLVFVGKYKIVDVKGRLFCMQVNPVSYRDLFTLTKHATNNRLSPNWISCVVCCC